MRNPSPNRQAGYSLLEVVVATGLLAMLSVIAFGGLRFGAAAWQRADAGLAGHEQARESRRILRQWLAYAIPFARVRADLEGFAAFTGDQHSASFAVPVFEGSGSDEPYLLRLRFDADAGQLLASWKPVLPLGGRAEVTEAVGERLLIDGLEGARFSYLGALPANGGFIWRKSWHGAKSLPLAIGLDLEFADQRHWPEFVVRTRLTGPLHCGLNGGAGDCERLGDGD